MFLKMLNTGLKNVEQRFMKMVNNKFRKDDNCNEKKSFDRFRLDHIIMN